MSTVKMIVMTLAIDGLSSTAAIRFSEGLSNLVKISVLRFATKPGLRLVGAWKLGWDHINPDWNLGNVTRAIGASCSASRELFLVGTPSLRVGKRRTPDGNLGDLGSLAPKLSTPENTVARCFGRDNGRFLPDHAVAIHIEFSMPTTVCVIVVAEEGMEWRQPDKGGKMGN